MIDNGGFNMLKFLSREKIEKTDGHVVWYDVLYDDDTMVMYFGFRDNVCPRLNKDGAPMIYRPL